MGWMGAQGCCGPAGEAGVSSLEAAEVLHSVHVGTSACVGAPSLLYASPRRDTSTPCTF